MKNSLLFRFCLTLTLSVFLCESTGLTLSANPQNYLAIDSKVDDEEVVEAAQFMGEGLQQVREFVQGVGGNMNQVALQLARHQPSPYAPSFLDQVHSISNQADGVHVELKDGPVLTIPYEGTVQDNPLSRFNREVGDGLDFENAHYEDGAWPELPKLQSGVTPGGLLIFSSHPGESFYMSHPPIDVGLFNVKGMTYDSAYASHREVSLGSALERLGQPDALKAQVNEALRGPDEGEDASDVLARVVPYFLENMMTKVMEGENVVAFLHPTVIQALRFYLRQGVKSVSSDTVGDWDYSHPIKHSVPIAITVRDPFADKLTFNLAWNTTGRVSYVEEALQTLVAAKEANAQAPEGDGLVSEQDAHQILTALTKWEEKDGFFTKKASNPLMGIYVGKNRNSQDGYYIWRDEYDTEQNRPLSKTNFPLSLPEVLSSVNGDMLLYTEVLALDVIKNHGVQADIISVLTQIEAIAKTFQSKIDSDTIGRISIQMAHIRVKVLVYVGGGLRIFVGTLDGKIASETYGYTLDAKEGDLLTLLESWKQSQGDGLRDSQKLVRAVSVAQPVTGTDVITDIRLQLALSDPGLSDKQRAQNILQTYGLIGDSARVEDGLSVVTVGPNSALQIQGMIVSGQVVPPTFLGEVVDTQGSPELTQKVQNSVWMIPLHQALVSEQVSVSRIAQAFNRPITIVLSDGAYQTDHDPRSISILNIPTDIGAAQRMIRGEVPASQQELIGAALLLAWGA